MLATDRRALAHHLKNIYACDPLALCAILWLTAWPPSDTMAYQNNTLCLQRTVWRNDWMTKQLFTSPSHRIFIFHYNFFLGARGAGETDRLAAAACSQPVGPIRGLDILLSQRERHNQNYSSRGRKMHAARFSFFVLPKFIGLNGIFSRLVSPVSERFIYICAAAHCSERGAVFLAWISWLAEDMLMRLVESGSGVRARLLLFELRALAWKVTVYDQDMCFIMLMEPFIFSFHWMSVNE